MSGISHNGEAQAANRRFVPPPGYTQFPNVLLDEVMPVASDAEWKVTAAIVRRTFGWGLGERLVTNAELVEDTGLSRTTVIKGIKEAEARGFIGRREAGGGKFLYGLRVKKLNTPPPEETGEGSRICTPGGSDSVPPTSKGKKSLRGKQNNGGAAPQGKGQKVDTLGKQAKPGATFKPNPDEPSHAVIVEAFDLWRTRTPQPDNTTLTVARARTIRSRLREQAEGCPDETALETARTRILEGLEGWFESPWHRDKQAYDFTTFFRSRGKVDAFRGRYLRAQAAADGKPDYGAYDNQVEN